MPGDYSRKLFNRKKHYRAVLEQQGRVQTDADWNEQVDLQNYRDQTVSSDLIGKTGVPKKGGGFKISVTANKADLLISAGRMYLNGLLFECEATPAASYLQQPHISSPDKSMFADGQNAVLKDGNYVVALEGWQREITYLDDPEIQEVALGEADTTTRLQNVWQVRILKTQASGTVDCKTAVPEWNDLIQSPTGKLNVQTTENTENSKPCLLPPKGGYSSLENQLYRVQIIRGGNVATATYAWSRDNASVETAVLNVSGSILTVANIGKDEILGFSAGQWVEIVETELSGALTSLFEIESVKPELKQIQLKTSANTFQGKPNLKLRRWDMSGTGLQNGAPLPTSWTNVENGIQLMFSSGTYKAGDYWLIPARTATASIEWPRDATQNSLPKLPLGVERHYARLALIKVSNGNITTDDCRSNFPALTEICAEDICYSNRGCTESTATTVQEALDELCHKRDGACTFIAFPGRGWEKVFDKIADGADAQICFQAGEYPLNNIAGIKNKGHLKLVGAGTGTRILASGPEAAILFEQCKSVTIRDLYASTSSFINKPPANTKHLNGIITCLDCPTVKMSDLVLQCGAASKKQVTCITTRNKAEAPGSVTIENCELFIGHYQQGILLINTDKTFLQNNKLSSHGTFSARGKELLLSDKKYISAARTAFVSKAGVKNLTATEGLSVVSLTSSGHTVNFLTSNSLKNDWNRLLSQNPATNIASAADLQKHVKQLAEKVLIDKNFTKIESFTALRRAMLMQTNAVGTRGITIAGTKAQDVKILNNCIENVLAGIHIGLSHRAERNVHDRAETVTIAGNTINITLPRDTGNLERHGIFAGNCRSISIQDNQISIDRLNGAERILIEGIKIWGILGERLLVEKNVICSKDGVKSKGFSTGILVQPLSKKTANQQWLVMYNIAPSRGSTIVVDNGVVTTQNTP